MSGCSTRTWTALLHATLNLPLDGDLERDLGKRIRVGPISDRHQITEAQALRLIKALNAERNQG